MLNFTILCFPLGIASYANTFVAQYHGARRPRRIGLAVFQGVILGLIAIPIFLALIPLAPCFFSLAGHTPELAQLETTYYQALNFGAGAVIIAAALSSFFTGRGKTWVVMLIDLSAVIVNAVLAYPMILGKWGFPRLGIAGAGYATAIAQWFCVVLFAVLMLLPANRRSFGVLEGLRYDPALMRRLLRFGGPNGLQLVIEVAAFSIFILLVGQLGKEAMAATTLAMTVNSLVFVPMVGVGTAVSTLVGQQLGRNRDDLAARATWTSFGVAMLYTATFAVLYVFTPDLFLIGHAMGADPREYEPLRATVVVLLRLVAAYCMFDAMTLVFSGAIKGAGDTAFVLKTVLMVSPVPMLVVFFGKDWLGLVGCWGVLSLWAFSLGVIYLTRFLQGKWRAMRVIEPELLSKTAVLSCTAD
jgi:MATE family multidrug resistance protein